MRSVFTVLALFAFLASIARAQGTPPADPSAVAPNIHITSCKVLSGPTLIPQANEIGLAVRFKNETQDTFSKILWRAKYGDGYVDFYDAGTFSPNVRIDNFILFDLGKAHVNILGALLAPRGASTPIDSQFHFPEYASLPYPQNCTIVKTETTDGKIWKNASLPQAHYLLPSPFPSAAATLAPGETQPKGPVDVAHCHVLFPWTRDTAQFDIGFRSIAPGKMASSVTFDVLDGAGILQVTDAGEFQDGMYVRHGKLKAPIPEGLQGISYFSFDDPSKCVPVRVSYTDGTTWNNPSAPSPAPAPTKMTNVLDRGLSLWAVRWQNGLALPAPSPSPQ